MLPVIHSHTEHEVMLIRSLPSVDDILAGQLAPSSIAMYRRDVAAYNAWVKSEGIDALNPRALDAWRDHLAMHTDLSPNTINRMLAAVKRLVREASRRKVIDASLKVEFDQVPGVKVKSLKSRLKHHSRTRIAPDDMRRLCETPDTRTLVGKRDAALLATLASSGVRASELATLTVGQIVKKGRGYQLQVCGKTDTEYRDAALSREAYDLIMQWIAARPVMSQHVFTSFAGRGLRATDQPLSETGVWKIVTGYAEQCHLAHIKPHDFRRFVGTQLAAKDIRKAQVALGHKSIEITARHYVLDELEVGLTDHLY